MKLYKIESATSLEGLTLKANKLIHEGWTAQGGVAIYQMDGLKGVLFFQAFTQ